MQSKIRCSVLMHEVVIATNYNLVFHNCVIAVYETAVTEMQKQRLFITLITKIIKQNIQTYLYMNLSKVHTADST